MTDLAGHDGVDPTHTPGTAAHRGSAPTEGGNKLRNAVLTIARGRRAHLLNMMQGLRQQTMPPDEMVIAVMGDAPFADLPKMPFPVRQVLVPGDPIPLAAARNAAAREAEAENLLFLDVDLIPSPGFVRECNDALVCWPGLLMGEVMYLPQGAADGPWSFEAFDRVAERHSDRQGPPAEGIRPCNDYRCFWSLNFALSRREWDRAGGFCEEYVGYGGEDTDFGRVMDEREIPIGWMKGGRAYHQHHPHHMPPVHHLDHILRNTRIFRSRWGEYTMGHWLHAFELMGLVQKCDEPGSGWRKLRDPGPAELALTMQQAHMPYANSSRVIRRLERSVAAE